MNLASDAARDAVAEFLGSVGEWLVGTVFGNWIWILVAALAGYLLLQVGLIVGSKRICRRCKGKGYKKAWLFGVNTCKTCGGNGLRPRLGAGGR